MTVDTKKKAIFTRIELFAYLKEYIEKNTTEEVEVLDYETIYNQELKQMELHVPYKVISHAAQPIQV